MSDFTRTKRGKVNESLFQDKVLVWIEGDTDFAFYERVLRDLDCKLKSAGGRPECEKLAEELVREKLSFVVVMDGDYNILIRKRSIHRWVIVLPRYSMENFLFEEPALKRVCANYCSTGDHHKMIAREFQRVQRSIGTKLRRLIVLDAARTFANEATKVLPRSADALLETGKEIQFSTKAISKLYQAGRAQITSGDYTEAEQLIAEFTKDKRLVDILKGHIILGILRRLVSTLVGRSGRRCPKLDNDSLRCLFTAEIWSPPLSKDHRVLKNRLRRAVREAIRSAGSTPPR